MDKVSPKGVVLAEVRMVFIPELVALPWARKLLMGLLVGLVAKD